MTTAHEAMAHMQAGLKVGGMTPLGYLCLWTISEGAQVDRPMLERWFKDLNLPNKKLPNQIFPSDAFARACASLEATRLLSGTPGIFLNLLTRTVGSDRYTSRRQLVIEEVDNNNKRLSYTPAMEFNVDRRIDKMTNPNGDNVSTRIMTYEHQTITQGLTQQFRDSYNHMLQFYPARQLRDTMRDLIANIGAASIQRSVYFVLEGYKDYLMRLEMLVDFFGATVPEGKNKSRLNVIVIPDTPKERDMVWEAITQQTTEELEKLNEEVAAMISSDKASLTACRHLLERIQEVGERATPYEAKLQNQLAGLTDGLSRVRSQVDGLIERAAAAV